MAKDNISMIYQTNGNNDECYTPEYGVTPLLDYITKDMVIWCPFDKENSNFVKIFKKNGNKVIYSHIDNGEDFFNYEPKEHWDIIISNPPFSNKKEIFKRAMSFNKPFCLLASMQWFNDAAPILLWKAFNRKMEILHFEDRMEFIGQGQKKIPFKCVYLCSDFLPHENILCTLELKNHREI